LLPQSVQQEDKEIAEGGHKRRKTAMVEDNNISALSVFSRESAVLKNVFIHQFFCCIPVEKVSWMFL
jgi:hypothetical protein